MIIEYNPSMTVYHTWPSYSVVGMMRVGKDLGMMGVDKDSEIVHEWVSYHFMV